MTYAFTFKTTYKFDEGLHDGPDQTDPTEYVAHLVGDQYRIVVERGNYEAYVEIGLSDVFDKIFSKEWIIQRSNTREH